MRERIAGRHKVLGLARSEAGAASLTAAGADVHRGSLEDLESLHRGAADSDGVIHAAFIHDFANYAAAAEVDRRAIETLGDALAGSDRHLVVTSGTALVAPGRLATEEDAVDGSHLGVERKPEHAAAQVASRGVHVSILRLPPTVYGDSRFCPNTHRHHARERRFGLRG